MSAKYPAETEPSDMPSVEDLDRMLTQAGLASAVKDWDQLDKDMLVTHLKSAVDDSVYELYPNIPRDRLRELKRLLTAR